MPRQSILDSDSEPEVRYPKFDRVKRDSLETVRDSFPECSQNVKDCCRNHTYFKMNLMKMAMLSKRLRVATWKIKAIFVLPVTCPVFSMLAAIR